MKKTMVVIYSTATLATLVMFQNCTNTRFQNTSIAESDSLKANVFDINNEVGKVIASGGQIPSENLRVSSILEASLNYVKECNRSVYDSELQEALEMVKNNPKLIPVQYSISFGVKADELAQVAHNRAILSEKRGLFSDKYIVPFSSYKSWEKSSGGNGFPGYYVKGYYKTDFSKAKSDYVLGKKCFFNTIEITGEGGMSGSYMDFLATNVSNVHGSHYLITGQQIDSKNSQFTLYDRVENLRAPQVIALFVADLRSGQFPAQYQDTILKETDAARGKTSLMNAKDIFNMKQLFQGYGEHIKSLSHDFKGDNGVVFSSMVGAPQLVYNLISGAQDAAELIPSQYTPIVLDLGAPGIKTTDANWGSFFDMAAKGAGPHKTAWIGGSLMNMVDGSTEQTATITSNKRTSGTSRAPASISTVATASTGMSVAGDFSMDVRRMADDGFLVLQGQDGHVSSSKNLFGDNLVINGKTYSNGFLALQALANKSCDSENIKDRYLGPWDKELYTSKIKVWIDANRNGLDDDGELFSLKDVGVVALNACNIVSQDETDQYGNGTSLRSAFLYSSQDKINALLADESEIVRQLENGTNAKGEKSEFRLAVDLIFQTYPQTILSSISQ